MKINFNELAWKSPRHENGYGYTPNDNFYNEIVAWLQSGERLHRTKEGNVTTTRIKMKDSDYDVIAYFHHENKMISWEYREKIHIIYRRVLKNGKIHKGTNRKYD